MGLNVNEILRRAKEHINNDIIEESIGGNAPVQNSHQERDIPIADTSSVNTKMPVNEATIKSSGLPDSIKQAMINNPINFEGINDVSNNPLYSNLIENQDSPTPPPGKTKKTINESSNSSLSESVIRFIVKEEIEKAMAKIKKPTISESQIKNTMIKMIKEGKLSIKKK